MNATREVARNIFAVGSSDRRLSRFENLIPIPEGVSYNAYLIRDEKTALLDGTDDAVRAEFLENVGRALSGRPLDYIIVQHMEPDHSAALADLLRLCPTAELIGNPKTRGMIADYVGADAARKMTQVADGEELSLGARTLRFIFTPMVHWPESMMSVETSEGILFSQDAFGAFGASSGSDTDDVGFDERYRDKMRRYYTNIVGKYGAPVQAVLNKTPKLSMICPLHGLVLREHVADAVALYKKWSAYEPEERGVMIVYASMYGHVRRAAEQLAAMLADRGVRSIAVFDASETDTSYLVAEAFRVSHIVTASVTYNASVYPKMEHFLADLKAIGVAGRAFSLIEGGSWAPIAAKLMRERIEPIKGSRIIGETVTVRGATYDPAALAVLADAIAGDVNGCK